MKTPGNQVGHITMNFPEGSSNGGLAAAIKKGREKSLPCAV
jgi:hypothetical protein